MFKKACASYGQLVTIWSNCSCRFLHTADGCSDSKVHGVCGACDRDEAIELVTISLHPLPKKTRGQRVCTYPVANHDME